MKNDKEKHGRTFWHREHQLPGQIWCPEHKLPLHYLESEYAFLMAPDQVIDESYTVPESWLMNTIENSHINSFLTISSALLESEKPFSVKHVSAILKDKASARGFQTHGGKVKSPLLSDAVVAEFGREWLATVLPRLADKREGEINSQLDGVTPFTLIASQCSSSSVITWDKSTTLGPTKYVRFLDLRGVTGIMTMWFDGSWTSSTLFASLRHADSIVGSMISPATGSRRRFDIIGCFLGYLT